MSNLWLLQYNTIMLDTLVTSEKINMMATSMKSQQMNISVKTVPKKYQN